MDQRTMTAITSFSIQCITIHKRILVNSYLLNTHLKFRKHGCCGFAGFTVFVFVFDFGGWVVVVVVVWLLWVWAMGLWGE